MGLDPRDVVADVARRARDSATVAPSVLERSPEPRPQLASMRSSEEVGAVHQQWARVHAAAEGSAAPAPAVHGAGGVRAKVRARVVTAATEAARSAQQDDRAMIGDLIRAVDSLARRTDELAARLGDLESVVHEVVGVLSEDVVALRAALAAATAGAPPDRAPA